MHSPVSGSHDGRWVPSRLQSQAAEETGGLVAFQPQVEAESRGLTHRCTAGLDSQSDSLHIHHTAGLRTQRDTGTVPSPEHIKSAKSPDEPGSSGLLWTAELLPCRRRRTASSQDHSCRAGIPTLRPSSSIRPRTHRRGCPAPPACRDTVLSASHRNRDSPEDSESPPSPAGHMSTLSQNG